MTLLEELNQYTDELFEAVRELETKGASLAKAEYEYKLAEAKEALQLKAEGMAIGLIDKVIYGRPTVAQKRLQRDIDSTLYRANLELINAIKKKMDIVRMQIQQEWGVAKYE